MTERSSGDAEASAAEFFFLLGRALDHPLRVRILKALTRGDASASELSRALRVPLSDVSYHVKVLRDDLSLLAVVAKNQKRGAIETVVSLPTNFITGLIVTVIVAVEAEAWGPQDGMTQFAWRSVTVDERGARAVGDHFRAGTELIETERRRCADRAAGPMFQLVVTRCAFAMDFPFPEDER